jgi:hypothetical protein
MMPLRFRKSFGRLVKLNISKTRVSISAGVKGAHVNYDLSGRRKKPTRVTVGIPGTGLSYWQDIGPEVPSIEGPSSSLPGPNQATTVADLWRAIALLAGIFVLLMMILAWL